MRPRRVLIHQRLTHRPILIARVHELHQLIVRLGRVDRQSFDEDALVGGFLDLQFVLHVLGQ